MCIDNGIYRGASIEVELVGETDGQIQVGISFDAPEIREHISCVTEEEMRQIFNFPDKDQKEFATKYDQNDGSLQWAFLFKCMKGTSTKFEYFAYIFRGIDQIIALVEERSKKPEQPAEAPKE